MDNNTKPIVFTILLLTVSILFSMQFVDRPLAIYLENHLSGARTLLYNMVTGLEWITGFNISKFLFGGILLIAGVVLYLMPKARDISGYFFFIGSTHIVSRLVAGTLKNVFHRSRPYEFLKDRDMNDFFVSGGSSFPSGHVAHFFSIFIPLMFIFPRVAALFLIVPAIVAAQRVVANDHYLSDVLAGVLIAYLFSLAFSKLFQRKSIWRHSI